MAIHRNIDTRKKCISMSAAVLAFTACNANAQSGELVTLEVVTVTAERRETDLQSTPISITTISGDALVQGGKSTIEDVMRGVPSVQIQTAGRVNSVSIRGIGLDTTPTTGGPGVAIYYDGVYDGRGESGRYGFFDVARIEALRGPQGTLYGKNATGGAVNIIYNDPKLADYSGTGTVGVGDRSALRASGALNVPFGESFAMRVAFNSAYHEGYMSDGALDENQRSGRVKLLFEPSEEFRLLLSAEHSRSNNGPGSFRTAWGDNGSMPDDPWRATGTGVGTYEFNGDNFAAQADVGVGIGTLTVLGGYRDFAARNESELTFAGVSTPLLFNPTQTQKSIEARLTSNADSAIKWVAGAYHYDSVNGNVSEMPLPAYVTEGTSKSSAVFMQTTIPLTGVLRVIAGGRYTWDKVGSEDTRRTGPAPELSWSRFDYRIGGEWDVATDSMLYATLSTGYRPGGYFGAGAGEDFDPEEITSYEIGFKNRFLDNRLQLNASAFLYDYTDFQSAATVFINSAPVTAVTNLASAEILGAELDVSWLLTAADRISLSGTYLDSKRDRLTGEAANTEFRLARTPEFQGRFDYEHVFTFGDESSLTLGGTATYQTESYMNNRPNPAALAPNIQDDYAQYDFRAVYQLAQHDVTISAFLRNAGNYAVKNQIAFQGANANVSVGAPRTFGMDVTARF